MIVGAGMVKAEVNQRQRWELVRKDGKRVLLERDSVILTIDLEEFTESWERV